MKERIVVALSGGVDSLSTAVYLQKDYQVIGLHLQMTETNEDLEEVRRICKSLDIPFFEKNIQKEFRENVIETFKNDYLNARTPNICTHCNHCVKIPALLEFADEKGINKVATGHYAQVIQRNDSYLLQMAADRWKDQSYMLYRLNQQQLSRLVLPLGGINKQDVKEYAAKKGFGKTAKQRESYSLCFTQGKNYKDFLLEQCPELSSLENGTVINSNGEQIGTHKGYPFYTVGQYKGLETKEKLYVTAIDHHQNLITAGQKSDCFHSTVEIDTLHLHQAKRIENCEKFLIKIRGKDEGTIGSIRLSKQETQDMPTSNNAPTKAIITFDNAVFAPMRGQDVVAYANDDTIVLGGVII